MTAGGSLFRASMSFAWAEPVAASHVASGPPPARGVLPHHPHLFLFLVFPRSLEGRKNAPHSPRQSPLGFLPHPLGSAQPAEHSGDSVKN